MKRVVAAVSLVLALSAYGQGSLTPPGAPGETMKTLDQVEPRIPISTAVYNIVRAGSYYLTTNIGGISIQADNVTLDLMGYSIAATGGSAVYFYAGYSNVVIRNGTISSTMGSGVYCAYAAFQTRGLIEQVRIQDCQSVGLDLPGGYIVRDCEVFRCGSVGIRAAGPLDIQNCHLEANGAGLIATNGSRITGNTILSSVATGLRVRGTGSYVADNIVKGNHGNYDLAAGNQLNLLISEIPETLDWPCSTKLAGTLTCSMAASNGLTVNADDVTIDLAGHALIGPGATSGHGIYEIPARHNLSLANGKVVNWRGADMSGVYAMGWSSHLSGIQAETNACGITAGSGSILEGCAAIYNTQRGIWSEGHGSLTDCTASENGGYDGIYGGANASLNRCSASYNGSNGIATAQGCVLDDCVAEFNGYSGIVPGQNSIVKNCSSSHNTLDGIVADENSKVMDCTAINNTGHGINIAHGCVVSGCVADGNGYGDATAAGIFVSAGQNRIDENHVTMNDIGIKVDGANNLIVRNSANGNTSDYDIGPANGVGNIVTNLVGGAGAWDNFVLY